MQNNPANTERTPFRYKELPRDGDVIRLLTILPLRDGETRESPLRVSIDHFSISSDHLAPGIKHLVSRFPSISFAEHVINRPNEICTTPHSLALAAKEKKQQRGLRRLFPKKAKTAEEEFSELDKETQDYFKELRLDAEISMAGTHREEYGGGYTIARGDGTGYSVSSDGIYLWKAVPSLRDKIMPQRQPQVRPRHIPTMLKKFVWGNYVALSYTWGSAISEDGINLSYESDDENCGALTIHKNLEHALRQFRDMPYFRNGGRIWIDEICINQQDDEEKATQIMMMSEIYQRAGNVVVWLGLGSEKLYDAIDIIQSTAPWYRTEWQEAFDDHDPKIAHTHRNGVEVELRLRLQMWRNAAQMDGASFYADDADKKLYEFFELPYWRRLWIIQELALGTADMAFVLGERVTEWRYIRDTAFVMAHISDLFAACLPDLPSPHTSICHVARIAHLEIAGHRKKLPADIDVQLDGLEEFPMAQRLRSGHGPGPARGSTLWQAFRLLSYARCFVPKDRVYGVLALPGLPNLKIVPDTTMHPKSTVEVFMEFTKACMDCYPNYLEILCLVDGATQEIDGVRLPSWVPNLASERETGIIEGPWKAGEKWTRFQAEGYRDILSLPDVFFEDNGILRTTVWIVDVVQGLGAISKTDPDFTNPAFDPSLVQPSNSESFYGDAGRGALWNCFVAGTDENGSRNPKGYEDLLGAFEDCREPSDHCRDSLEEFLYANIHLELGNIPLSRHLEPLWLYRGLRGRDGRELSSRILQETSTARQTMASRTKRKRLMVTAKGMLGLVPNSVQVGDAIMLIHGHGRPVVARPATAGEWGSGHYQLKGEAYVHGIMRGELLEPEYEQDWKRVNFV